MSGSRKLADFSLIVRAFLMFKTNLASGFRRSQIQAGHLTQVQAELDLELHRGSDGSAGA